MNNKREKIETLKAALQKGEEKLRRAEREVKLLEEKRKAMTRKERTHRTSSLIETDSRISTICFTRTF